MNALPPGDSAGFIRKKVAFSAQVMIFYVVVQDQPLPRSDMRFHALRIKAVILVLMSLTGVLADGNTVGKHNIGAGAGFVTGYGLSYRQWFDRNGLQLTFAPYYNQNSSSTDFTLSLGATGLYLIKEAKYVNLIAYYGPHFWYSSHRNSLGGAYDPVTGMYTSSYTSTQKLLFVGGGPGFDFHFWKISFNLMFGFAFRTDFENNSGISFTGETALYYSF
jgi:hypothetical protein